MNAKQVIDYICEVLNINTDSSLIILDMIEELKEIQDLQGFKLFIKSRVANLNDDYRYLSGYQKFIKCISDFKKKQKDLIVLQNPSINSFSEALYKKTVLVFEEVNWHLQNGKRIEDFNMLKSFDEKELRVLNKIGDKSYILTKVKSNKPSLEEEIKNIVMSYTIQKHTISTALPFKDKEVIKKISKN